MSAEEISEYNETILSAWGTDWNGGYYDIEAFPQQVEGDWLEERILFLDLRNTERYHKGEAITAEEWEQYYDNTNLDAIPEEKEVSYAVTNDNARALDLPTEDIFTGSDMNEEFNSIQETTLRLNEPVVILHESKDGEWVFAAANEFIGWVEKENCSFFATRQEWLDYQAQDNFVMVTKDCEEAAQTLYMGTKLFLAEGSSAEEDEYMVVLPGADEEGYITYEEIAISGSEAIRAGYLPFTRENIVTLAFQELGEPYGWGGIDGKRDCSSYVKDIYACFGFRLPRNSRLQQTMPEVAEDISACTEEEKLTSVGQAKAGDILGISGHIMLYLGEANGKHYVISMLSSYVPEDVTENYENSVESISKVKVNSLNVRRRNGNTWLQELNAIVDFE